MKYTGPCLQDAGSYLGRQQLPSSVVSAMVDHDSERKGLQGVKIKGCRRMEGRKG